MPGSLPDCVLPQSFIANEDGPKLGIRFGEQADEMQDDYIDYSNPSGHRLMEWNHASHHSLSTVSDLSTCEPHSECLLLESRTPRVRMRPS